MNKTYSFSKSYNINQAKEVILVVDDDRNVRFVLKTLFQKHGYIVETSGNYSGLLRLIKELSPNLLITDVRLPDGNVLQNLFKIQEKRPKMPIIVISALSTLSTAVNAIKLGAFEYISKPFNINEVLEVSESALRSNSQKKGKLLKNENLANFKSNHSIIGKSKSMQKVFQSISKLIGNNLTVLITGETGTGKDLVANTIHNFCNQNNKFYKINMGITNFSEIEKLIFAVNERQSTIYLDAIDEMSIENQLKLLDLLRLFYSNNKNKVVDDIRIIVSSKKNLTKLILKGLFREDLFYYLNIVPLFIPPLKDRKEDIKELTINFLHINRFNNLPVKKFNENSFEELMNYNWPGNIKELENFIKRISVLYPESIITDTSIKNELNKSRETIKNDLNEFTETLDLEFEKFFNQENIPQFSEKLYDYFIKKYEKSLIKKTLNSVNGNQIKASRLLGINRNTLRKKIIELEIEIIKRIKN